MKFIGDFSGYTELPVNAFGPPFEQLLDVLNQPVDINYWVTRKYRRQTIGETAIDTFSRSLFEVELKLKPVLNVFFKFKTDIKSTF